MPSRIQRELALLLTGKDVSWSKTTRGAERSVNRLGKIGAKAGTNLGRNIERGVVIGAAAATTAVGFAIDQAIKLESSSASVQKTVGEGWQKVVEANKELAKTTPVDVNTLNEISAAAGAMGVEASGVDEFTRAIALLSVTADDVDAAAGAEFLGHLRTNMKLTDAQILETADLVTHLGNNSTATEGDILAMAEGVSGAAGIVHASLGDVMAWSAAMASAGEEAEAGGSAIQRVWIDSAKFVAEGGDELKLMAKISDRTVAQFKKDFGKDAPGTLAKFIVKLGQMTEAQQLATLESLGWGDIRITRAMTKMLANTDNLTGAYKELGSAEGATQREAEIRFATSAAQLEIFRNNVDLAAASVGTKLLPILNELAREGVDWIIAHEGDIEQFGEDLAGGIREAVRWAKTLDWDLIGASLKDGATGAKAIADMFASLPPWIQQAVLTGWGLNKLTGGAVIDIGKLAFEQVFSRGASPANPLWVAQVGGPLPGAPGGPPGRPTPGAPGRPTPGGGGGGGTGGAGFMWTPEIAAIAEGTNESKATLAKIYAEVHGVNTNTRQSPPMSPDERQVANDLAAKVREAASQAQRRGEREVQTEAQTKAAIDASKARLAAVMAETKRETTRGMNLVAATERVTASRILPAAMIARKGGDAAAAAIRAKDLSVVLNNKVVNNLRFTIRDAQANLTFQQNMQRFG